MLVVGALLLGAAFGYGVAAILAADSPRWHEVALRLQRQVDRQRESMNWAYDKLRRLELLSPHGIYDRAALRAIAEGLSHTNPRFCEKGENP